MTRGARLRSRLLEQWNGMLERTGMFVPTSEAADALARQILWTVAYLDGREDEFTAVTRTFRLHDFGSLGPAAMTGWFAPDQFDHDGAARVVAWWAEVAHVLGSLDVRRTSETEWTRLTDSAGTDLTRGDLEAGPAPALVVGRRVFCYAPPDPSGRWAYVDLQNATAYPWQTPDDPVLWARLPGEGLMRTRLHPTSVGRPLVRHPPL